MPEIVFDSFYPIDACLEPPPQTPQKKDPCRIDAVFHLRDESKAGFTVPFQRERDHFILDTSDQGHEVSLGLMKGSDFSLSDPKIQSALFYSIALERWIQTSYPDFVHLMKYSGPSLKPVAIQLRNFVITGSVLNPDSRQRELAASLLKNILGQSSPGRFFFQKSSLSLFDEVGKGKLLPEMRPRIEWLIDFTQAFEKMMKGLETDPPHDALQKPLTALLVYLGTGEGDLSRLQEAIKGLSHQEKSQTKLSNFLHSELRALEGSTFFRQSPDASKRLKDVFTFLNTERLRVEETRRPPPPPVLSILPSVPKKEGPSPAYLPWIEGGICLVGLGLGAAGIGAESRELTVSGAGAGGLGCGSLITHGLFQRTRQTLSDSLGGLVGAGLGFGLSWYLTESSSANPPNMNPNMGGNIDGRNTVTGRGP